MIPKILFVILFTNFFIFAKETPLRLADDITKETSVFTRVRPEQWEEVGYRGITKMLSDAVIDDSGYVHLIVDEYYRGNKHNWLYLRYDKEAKILFKRNIHSANYLTRSHSALVSRILINPDMTALVFYPDSEFYTCWVKVDHKGNTIEKHEPKWWRGDARFRVCCAGQDSFHIVTFPVQFWSELIKKYNPETGEYYYLEAHPSRILKLFYSNNFFLKEERMLTRPSSTPVPRIISLPQNKIFCFSNDQHDGSTWIMDSKGNSYEAEGFEKKNLEKLCFAKIVIDTILSRLGIEMPIFPDLADLQLFADNTIGVGVFWKGSIYLIKYDSSGNIIQKGKGASKLVHLGETGKNGMSSFITQVINPDRFKDETGVLERAIFYWGFDENGNFFLQIY